MDSIKQISAFEIYAKKRNNVQSTFSLHKHRRDKSTKLIKNGKIEKQIKAGKIENQSKLVNSAVKKLIKNNLKHKKNKSNTMKVKTLAVKLKPNKEITGKSEKLTDVPSTFKEQIELLLNKDVVESNKIYAETLDNDNQSCDNPIRESEKLFEWLIYPLKKEEFFENNWEKTPLHIKRNKSKYYRSLMSTPILDKVLRDNHILFTKNIDITSFTNDVRETHNPPGRALPSVVWDYFLNGCSVRMLNPQTYISKLHTLNATLQEFFGCFVGANSYLTPPNSQGFAPHYDDIEAFILQIEGKKRWRLYKPRNDSEFLPRFSSLNFSEKEIGEPILDTVVNAGDLLYFPRGTIHQGDTFGFDQHSLHITLSVYQKNSWGDFLEKILPIAIKDAIQSDARFRKGLPLNYLRHIGTAFSNTENSIERQEFLNKTKSLLSSVFLNHINIDKAADEMAKGHIHDFLPPVLDEDENLCSVYEGGEKMIKDGMVVNRVEIEPDTFIRLSRAHCVRLVEENGLPKLYYSCENSKEYHEFEPQFLEVDPEFIPAIQEIIVRFPQYVKVEDLPMNDLDKKIQIVRDLWEKAIVVSEQPLPIIED